MRGDPVKVAVRVDSFNPEHTHLSVFIGRNEGARAHCGHLTVRTDEWREIVDKGVGLLDHPAGSLVIEFDVMPPAHLPVPT